MSHPTPFVPAPTTSRQVAILTVGLLQILDNRPDPKKSADFCCRGQRHIMHNQSRVYSYLSNLLYTCEHKPQHKGRCPHVNS
ncbi:hypothetical protein XELAEV_18026289mg [Xenopus laevis]|uniref:Uncharacterized protein n=1 Tax=Xenopus laevis TaxID=8355 RepID=A0A974CTK0_XENLA|nr:hypothetical protein XELAEV_18026289mg [Xenopus laevis]